MKEKLKSVGTVILGIFILIASILVPILFLKGGLWISVRIEPFLKAILYISMLLSIIILLPTALFRRTRGIAGLGLFIASYVFGANLWVHAFLLTYMLWGWVALIIGLLFMGIGVVPIAMLATIFKGEWYYLGDLVLLLLFTLGARIFGMYLAAKYEEQSEKLNARTTA